MNQLFKKHLQNTSIDVQQAILIKSKFYSLLGKITVSLHFTKNKKYV